MLRQLRKLKVCSCTERSQQNTEVRQTACEHAAMSASSFAYLPTAANIIHEHCVALFTLVTAFIRSRCASERLGDCTGRSEDVYNNSVLTLR